MGLTEMVGDEPWTDPQFVAQEALRNLVALKDGPRDDTYYAQREQAWQEARAAVRALDGAEVVADPGILAALAHARVWCGRPDHGPDDDCPHCRGHHEYVAEVIAESGEVEYAARLADGRIIGVGWTTRRSTALSHVLAWRDDDNIVSLVTRQCGPPTVVEDA